MALIRSGFKAGLVRLISSIEGLSAIAAMASAAAAGAAWWTAVVTDNHNTHIKLLEIRHDAFRNVIAGSGTLRTAINETSAILPTTRIDIFDPAKTIKLSYAQSLALAPATARVGVAYQAFETALNSERGVWSDRLERQIIALGNSSIKLVYCYAAAGSPQTTKNGLITQRLQLTLSCPLNEERMAMFDVRMQVVSRRMLQEMRHEMEEADINRDDEIGDKPLIRD